MGRIRQTPKLDNSADQLDNELGFVQEAALSAARGGGSMTRAQAEFFERKAGKVLLDFSDTGCPLREVPRTDDLTPIIFIAQELGFNAAFILSAKGTGDRRVKVVAGESADHKVRWHLERER